MDENKLYVAKIKNKQNRLHYGKWIKIEPVNYPFKDCDKSIPLGNEGEFFIFFYDDLNNHSADEIWCESFEAAITYANKFFHIEESDWIEYKND